MPKVCPNCKTQLDDKVFICPNCHSYVGELPSEGNFIFCEGCGARIKPGDRICPKCGRPAPAILSTKHAASDLAAGNTSAFHVLTPGRIDNASKRAALQNLPSTLDNAQSPVIDSSDDVVPYSSRKSHRQVREKKLSPCFNDDSGAITQQKGGHHRILILAICAALLVVLGSFCVFDPLDIMPSVWDYIATNAQELFPVRNSSNQSDKGAALGTPVDENRILSNEEVFTKIDVIYQRLLGFKDQFDEVIRSYNGYYVAYDYQSRVNASANAYALRDACDKTIEELNNLNLPQDCIYTQDIEHLISLATWMRGRADTMCQSWDISLQYKQGDNPGSHVSEITQPLRDCLDENGVDQNRQQFNEHLFEWAPVEQTVE